jgi:hypothetical protein
VENSALSFMKHAIIYFVYLAEMNAWRTVS